MSRNLKSAVPCAFVDCPNTTFNTGKKFFNLPSRDTHVFQRNKWIAILNKRNGVTWKMPSDIETSCLVCSDHFVSGEPAKFANYLDYVPSVFPNSSDSGRRNTVTLRQFAMEYIIHDALLEKPTTSNVDNIRRRSAYSLLASALNISELAARSFEKRFRFYFEQKMASLARSGKPLASEPPWVQQVEARLQLLQKLPSATTATSVLAATAATAAPATTAAPASQSTTTTQMDQDSGSAVKACRRAAAARRVLTPGGVISALTRAARARGVLCSSALYTQVRRALRIAVTNTTLHAIWVQAQRVSLEQVIVCGRGGDKPAAAAPSDAATLADLVLLYTDVDMHQLITPDSITLYEEATALHQLWALIQTHRAEEARVQSALTRAQRWTRVHKQYQQTGRVASIIVLQRRWHELKLQARSALVAYWRRSTTTSATSDTGVAPPATTPAPIHLNIIKRYPHVVTSRQPSWRQLVLEGIIVTEPLTHLEESDSPPFDLEDIGVCPQPDDGDICANIKNAAMLQTDNEEDDKVVVNVDGIKIEIEQEPINSSTIEVLKTIDPSTVKTEIQFESDSDDNELDTQVNNVDIPANVKRENSLTSKLVFDDDDDFNNVMGRKEVKDANSEEWNQIVQDACVSLIRVDDTAIWQKHAKLNTINISNIDINKLCPVNNKRKHTEGCDTPSKIAKSNGDELLLEVKSKEIIITRPALYQTDSSEDETLAKDMIKKQVKERSGNIVYESEISDESVSSESSGEEFFTNKVDKKKWQKKKAEMDKLKGKKQGKKRGGRAAASTVEWSSQFEPVFGETRVHKRVELPNIDDVRRVNSGLLTAQVAPITAQANESQPPLASCESTEDPEEELVPTHAQLKNVLDELSTASCAERTLQPAAHCCLARRHRAVNDARRAVGLPDIPIHTHGGAPCSCCCAHVCDGDVRARIAAQLRALHNDIAYILQKPSVQLNRDKNVKTFKRKKSAASNVTPAKTNDDKPGDMFENMSTNKPSTSSYKPSTAALSASDGYDEWLRQKNVNSQYFCIKPVDKNKLVPNEPKTSATVQNVTTLSTTTTSTVAATVTTPVITVRNLSSTTPSTAVATVTTPVITVTTLSSTTPSTAVATVTTPVITVTTLSSTTPSTAVATVTAPFITVRNLSTTTTSTATATVTTPVITVTTLSSTTPSTAVATVTAPFITVRNLSTTTTSTATATVTTPVITVTTLSTTTTSTAAATVTTPVTTVANVTQSTPAPFNALTDRLILIPKIQPPEVPQAPPSVLSFKLNTNISNNAMTLVPTITPCVISSNTTNSVEDQSTVMSAPELQMMPQDINLPPPIVSTVSSGAPVGGGLSRSLLISPLEPSNTQTTTAETIKTVENCPKISVVPFENLAQTPTVNTTQEAQSMMQPINTEPNFSILEHLSKSMTQSGGILNARVNTMKVIVTGPQGSQTTTLMALTLPKQQSNDDVVDLTEDDNATELPTNTLKLNKVTAGPPQQKVISKSHVVVIPKLVNIPTKAIKDSVEVENLLNEEDIRAQLRKAVKYRDEELYTYKREAGSLPFNELPCSTTLLCIDASRCPLRIRDPAGGGAAYLVLTSHPWNTRVPTYWTLTEPASKIALTHIRNPTTSACTCAYNTHQCKILTAMWSASSCRELLLSGGVVQVLHSRTARCEAVQARALPARRLLSLHTVRPAALPTLVLAELETLLNGTCSHSRRQQHCTC